MKNVLVTLCIVVAVGLLAYPRVEQIKSWLPNNVVTAIDVPPAELFGLDKVVPSTLTDKKAATILSGVCDGLADRIEADGKRAVPILNYAGNIEELRLSTLDLSFDGKSVKEVLPQFGAAVGPVFSSVLPSKDVALTPEVRAEAVALFKALAYVCRK